MEKIKELVNKEYEFSKYEKVMIILLIFVISGIFGFIYETLFYRIDLGYFVKRGTTFGPWIPIYGFGGVLIYTLNKNLKHNLLLTFIYSALICGVLEFLTGYTLYHFINGLRLWNYNTEIWNFGNIGGYICLRSVAFFGLSGVILMYLVTPLLNKCANKMNKTIFSLIALVLFGLFTLDIILSIIIK